MMIPLDEMNKRIVDALIINKKLFSFNLQHYQPNSTELKKFIGDVNATWLHYSANCTLLATLVMYNCLNPNNIFLAAKNTYPIMAAIPLEAASHFLLGQRVERYSIKLTSIDEVENKILECYHKTGEYVFLIAAGGYRLPLIGETGHFFNAIVLLNENKKPTIQFADAWKTSNHLPSKYDLKEKYSGNTPSYDILFCKDKKLLKDFRH